MSDTDVKRGRPPKALTDQAEHEAFQAREAERQKKKSQQPPVKKEWYEWALPTDQQQASKKGRKLVWKRLTENGVSSDYIGFEKRIPAAFMKKIKDKLRAPGSPDPGDEV